MHYQNDERVILGDYVRLYRGCRGVVVCDADHDCYDSEYPKEQWQEMLGSGVLILTKRIGLVHLTDASGDLELIRRQQKRE